MKHFEHVKPPYVEAAQVGGQYEISRKAWGFLSTHFHFQTGDLEKLNL